MNSNIITGAVKTANSSISSTASVVTTSIASQVGSKTMSTASKIAAGTGIVGLVALAGFGIYKMAKKFKANKAEDAAREAETERICAETDRLVAEAEDLHEEIKAETEEVIEGTIDAINDVIEMSKKAKAEKADETSEVEPEIAEASEIERHEAYMHDMTKILVDIIREKGHVVEGETAEQTAARWIRFSLETTQQVDEHAKKILGQPFMGGTYAEEAAAQVALINIDTYINADNLSARQAKILSDLDKMAKDLGTNPADHVELGGEVSEEPKEETPDERRARLKAEKEPWTVVGSEQNVALVGYIRRHLDANSIEFNAATTDEDGNMIEPEALIRRIAWNIGHILLNAVHKGELEDRACEFFIAELQLVAKATEVKGATVSNMALKLVETIPAWLIDTSNLISMIEDCEYGDDKFPNAAKRSDFKVATASPSLDFTTMLTDTIKVGIRKVSKAWETGEPWTVVGSDANLKVAKLVRDELLDTTPYEEYVNLGDDHGEYVKRAIRNIQKLVMQMVHDNSFLDDDNAEKLIEHMKTIARHSNTRYATIRSDVCDMIAAFPKWVSEDAQALISRIRTTSFKVTAPENAVPEAELMYWFDKAKGELDATSHDVVESSISIYDSMKKAGKA